jgi:hypothetical protein
MEPPSTRRRVVECTLILLDCCRDARGTSLQQPALNAIGWPFGSGFVEARAELRRALEVERG